MLTYKGGAPRLIPKQKLVIKSKFYSEIHKLCLLLNTSPFITHYFFLFICHAQPFFQTVLSYELMQIVDCPLYYMNHESFFFPVKGHLHV